MCKHVAAVLYGVGARLDEQPELLFRLRAVDETDLLARSRRRAAVGEAGAPDAGKVLEADDLSALFGLDMDAGAEALTTGGNPPAASRKPLRARKPPRPDPSGDTRPPKQMQVGKRAAIGRMTAGEPPLRSPMRPRDGTKVNIATKMITTKSARKMKAAI